MVRCKLLVALDSSVHSGDPLLGSVWTGYFGFKCSGAWGKIEIRNMLCYRFAKEEIETFLRASRVVFGFMRAVVF